jgi:hypothetical protein
MSKSDNIKRAKLLRQQKKERKKQLLENDLLLNDKQVLKERAGKNNSVVIDRSLLAGKEKISTILLEMIKPVLFTAQDEEDARGIISMGVAAWNCGILKQTIGEEKLKDVMKSFKSNENSAERKLLVEYINIKCDKFGQYNDLITDFQVSFERDGKLNFTVLTGISKPV